MSTDFKTKAEFFAFLDKVRWIHPNNYDEINYSHKDDLSPDEKLLTHWLCYISDRAMGYKRIWDVGGFVYSDLVFCTRSESIDSLLKPDGADSFIISRNSNESKKEKQRSNENEGSNKEQVKIQYMFISRESGENNSIISKSYSTSLIENNKVSFSPRYYPSDYVSIYYTLYTLNYLKCSFGEYIAKIISKAVELSNNKDKHRDIMMCLFCGFYVLSYSNIGQPKSDKIDSVFQVENEEKKDDLIELSKNPGERAVRIEKWLGSNREIFIQEAKNVYNAKRYNSKRIWCCIRDYLKHTNYQKGFCDLMRNSLSSSNISDDTLKNLFSGDMKNLLELPGDTWNNKTVFRHCLLKGDAEESSGKAINKVLREKYDNNETDVYPEQFDVSFAFVPRMCNQGNCRYCPISDDKDKGEIEKLCSAIKGQYCPAILMYTGFFYECPGKKECKLKDFI